jgi:hypothetical protein
MEEEYFADRTTLRRLLTQRPDWTTKQYMAATGRSRSWVKKWRQRLRKAAPDDDRVLHGLSRARHTPPAPIQPQVIERILEIRDHPPDNLRRVPGPKAILYYLHQDQGLKASDVHLPTSTRTVWQILERHRRIYRAPTPEHELVERPEPMSSWQWDFKDVSSVPADPEGKQQHVVETFNVVDVGTSILLEAVVRDDFTGETALMAVTHTLREHGRPDHVTFTGIRVLWAAGPAVISHHHSCAFCSAWTLKSLSALHTVPTKTRLSSVIIAAMGRSVWLFTSREPSPPPRTSPKPIIITITGSGPLRR